MAVVLKFSAYPNSQKYANGLDVIELYLDRQHGGLVVRPKEHEPRDITFIAGSSRYKGRLITYPPTGDLYIGPALYAEPVGEKTTLADVLNSLGIKPRQDVDVEAEGDVFRLVGAIRE